MSNHYDDYQEDADVVSQRRDSETATTSSYVNVASATPISMVYLPQTVVLCELRHDAFEASTPTGPSDSGLVSKWRPKDRGQETCVDTVMIQVCLKYPEGCVPNI